MHTKLMQNLQGGSQAKGYSHTVCVRKEKQDVWTKKGYVVIEESADAILLGKKKVEAPKAPVAKVIPTPVVEAPKAEATEE